MNVKQLKLTVIGIAVASALGSVYSFGPWQTITSANAETQPVVATSPVVATPTAAMALPDMGAIVARHGPAVVNVSVSGKRKMGSVQPDMPQLDPNDPLFQFFRRFGAPRGHSEIPKQGQGSGFIVSSDGIILTNAHVVEGATEVRVRFAGDTEPVTAVVVAADAGNDLALLKVDAQNLVAATFAKPGSVRVGDQVVAIGYALALDGGPSVTTGIVSAMRRTIFTDSGALNSLIQTDAAISSGNSGGPLANMRGEVVGINTAVARGSNNSAANNIGFAISVDEVLTVLEQLREQASGVPRTEGFLGVSLEARNDGGAGSIIATVQPGSPAEQAGVLIGDIVLAVDGEPVNGQAGLVAAIRDRTPGDSISIDLVRDGERLTVSAVLVARPQD